jgi:thioredoxin 1
VRLPRNRSLIIAVIAVFLVILTGIWFSTPAAGAQDKGSKPPQAAKLPRLVDVGADKCIPCIMMAPILEELKKEYAGILDVEFVDVWKNPKAGQKYGIRGIPTQIFYDASGKELDRHMGYISKEQILQSFKKLGIELKNPEQKKKR